MTLAAPSKHRVTQDFRTLFGCSVADQGIHLGDTIPTHCTGIFLDFPHLPQTLESLCVLLYRFVWSSGSFFVHFICRLFFYLFSETGTRVIWFNRRTWIGAEEAKNRGHRKRHREGAAAGIEIRDQRGRSHRRETLDSLVIERDQNSAWGRWKEG